MKATKQTIEDFLNSKNFLFYGVSADRNKFGNSVFKHLQVNGYNVIPVHPELKQINGIDCMSNIKEIDDKPESAIIIMSPENTDKVITELIDFGIKKIWIQQRCESDNSLHLCANNNIEVITGECIMMFAKNINLVHRVHKWINKVTGKLPV